MHAVVRRLVELTPYVQLLLGASEATILKIENAAFALETSVKASNKAEGDFSNVLDVLQAAEACSALLEKLPSKGPEWMVFTHKTQEVMRRRE